ncbi:MAG TPA: zeta toxin family protein [Planctomycetaceae bacterium]|nr:zeta toxin family protein [Planctomycetaceae bacterium]
MSDRPSVVVIAGPNGAGKSTAAPAILRDFAGIPAFVNADVIAQGLSAFDPETEAIEAGRIILRRMREFAAAKRSFAFETTLASRTFASWLQRLKAERGYRIFLYYVWLRSADEAVQRVASRVSRGGHHVPEDIVRRRYQRSAWNFFHLYEPLADAWGCYDNSQPSGLKVIAKRSCHGTLEVVETVTWQSFRELADG